MKKWTPEKRKFLDLEFVKMHGMMEEHDRGMIRVNYGDWPNTTWLTFQFESGVESRKACEEYFGLNSDSI